MVHAPRFVAPRLRAWSERQARRRGLEERLTTGARALAPLALPLCWLTFQWLSVFVASALQWP